MAEDKMERGRGFAGLGRFADLGGFLVGDIVEPEIGVEGIGHGEAGEADARHIERSRGVDRRNWQPREHELPGTADVDVSLHGENPVWRLHFTPLQHPDRLPAKIVPAFAAHLQIVAAQENNVGFFGQSASQDVFLIGSDRVGLQVGD